METVKISVRGYQGALRFTVRNGVCSWTFVNAAGRILCTECSSYTHKRAFFTDKDLAYIGNMCLIREALPVAC